MRVLRLGNVKVYMFTLALILWILFLALDYFIHRTKGPPVEVPVVKIPTKKPNIIFIESSCSAENTLTFKPLLTNRQACALESAARANPRSTVYYFFTCPYFEGEDFRVPEQQALSYQNVKAVHVNMNRVFKNTPLDAWHDRGELEKSMWPKVHGLVVLKTLLLWKYGGIYMDLDIITLRSLGDLENFVVRGEGNSLEFSAVGLDSDDIGNIVSSYLIDDVRNYFNPDYSSSIGPSLLQRAMEDLCGVSQVEFMTPDICDGFSILLSDSFIPLKRREWRLFLEDDANIRKLVMERLRDSYGVKTWEELTNSTPISAGSHQPLSMLAAEYCPKVFKYSGTNF